MITENNIISHELIGLQTEVVRSRNSQIIGLNGRVVDETKSMLHINTKNGIKSIPKSINRWKFSIGKKDITVEGDKIAKRSFERLGRKI